MNGDLEKIIKKDEDKKEIGIEGIKKRGKRFRRKNIYNEEKMI
jgi:hypothetical protein